MCDQTLRGSINKGDPLSIVYDIQEAGRSVSTGCIQSLDWTGGLDSWTHVLDASDAAITLATAGVMYFTDSRTRELSWK